jgi:Ca2+/Na+ antiporter
MYILGFPLLVLFTITIPDCATKKFEKWYVVSFIMSILWIGVLCHVMVEFAVGVACILKVEPVIMGILVLAIGTSVPDAIGSMIAARNGEADMAIANAVGSNVFDVLLGLGFPWFLAVIIKKKEFQEMVDLGTLEKVGFPVAKDGIQVSKDQRMTRRLTYLANPFFARRLPCSSSSAR